MSVVPAFLENKICVIADDSESLGKAHSYADFFQCSLNPEELDKFFFHFHVGQDRVYVRDLEKRVLEIDFDKNHLDYERKGHRGKNELIAKALGVAKGHHKILDLSVGLAVDSIF